MTTTTHAIAKWEEGPHSADLLLARARHLPNLQVCFLHHQRAGQWGKLWDWGV